MTIKRFEKRRQTPGIMMIKHNFVPHEKILGNMKSL